ncbi:MAG: hypothetical protein GTO14_15110 [Anaerolineales bacterium]|nr:hypothetical protein [Anaerolineales bacterium]
MLERLRHLLRSEGEEEVKDSEKTGVEPSSDKPVSDPQPPQEAAHERSKVQTAQDDPEEDAQVYLERVRKKMNKLAEEFAAGLINREQFQELFDHYQREQRTIETWLDTWPGSDAWRKARTEGKSVAIRRRHRARILGYAVYKNDSGMPIATIGEFELDAALIVPMLSSYRSATREIFGAGMRSTQIENGQWLCFVPGEVTTLMTLFTTEPSSNQLSKLEDLHRLFESANRHFLREAVVDASKLAFPHTSLLR